MKAPSARSAKSVSALAVAPERRLLVARGPFVVELDVRNASAPAAEHTLSVQTGLQWLRVDEIDGRVYGLGPGMQDHRKPVLDLREADLVLRGQHNVPKWVRRHDAGRLSVRFDGRDVQIVEVLR